MIKKDTSSIWMLTLLLLCSLLQFSCKESSDPLDEKNIIYYNIEVAGFNLAIQDGIPESEPSLQLLKDDLLSLPANVPQHISDKMKEEKIYIVTGRGNEYVSHDSKDKHHAGSVVIGSLAKYRDDRKLRLFIWGLLLTMYYDNELTGGQKTEALNIYNSVKSKYDKVYYFNGVKLEKTKVQVPAATGMLTYLTEITKCYADTNYYYPFVYEELGRFDPEGFGFLKKVIGDRDIEPNDHGITLPPVDYVQGVEVSDDGKSVISKVVPIDLWYSKYIVAKGPDPDKPGLPVVASRFVSDLAIMQAKYIMEVMLSRNPEALVYMLENNYRVGIVGAYENITDLPETRAMPIWWPDTDWDARGRGYGATNALPIMTCGEENIIKMPEPYKERYSTESIMVHEFAHVIDFGLRGAAHDNFGELLDAAYKHAMDNKLWYDTYSASNAEEYWAEGVQAWFYTCRMMVFAKGQTTGQKSIIKYRTQLMDYDPMLYDLISKYMPDVKLIGYHFDYE